MNGQPAGKPTNNSQSPLTDSPWFWLYLFSTFGLIVAIAFAPKITARQRELDLEAVAKRRAVEHASNPATASTEKSEPSAFVDDSENSLNSREFKFRFYTLLLILGILTASGWVGLWWRRLRPNHRGG